MSSAKSREEVIQNLFAVFKDSVESTGSDMEHWLDVLRWNNEIAEALGEYVKELVSLVSQVKEEKRCRLGVPKLMAVEPSEWCFDWKEFGLKSWDTEKAALAWQKHLTQMYAPKGAMKNETIVAVQMEDLGRDDVGVFGGEIRSGRRVRTRFVILDTKKVT